MTTKNIKDVAREANVSIATVSRILQNEPNVADDTRQRVLAAIARLGYAPNAIAQNMRSAKTKLIVVLVSDITNMFFAGVVRGIEIAAHQNGYAILLGTASVDDYDQAQRYADFVSLRRADGLISLLPFVPKLNTHTKTTRAPIVFVSENAEVDVCGVHIDNTKAMAEATEYLLALGHQRIAFVRGRMNSHISAARERGFRNAMAAAGLNVVEELVVSGDYSLESGSRAVDMLFDGGAKFTAILCSNDEMAIGAYQTVHARGLTIPKDVSIMGFDNVRLARYLAPPLTTVLVPTEEMGREAMALLLGLLRGENVPKKRFLQSSLIVRKSTARPATA